MCIYEDQIGKFDWRQTYVGRIKFAQFDTVSTAKKLIVATEENVLAALHLKTGQVVWRHVFESASTGNIQLLHVSDKIVTVSGSNPYLVRGWDSGTGVLLWEWSLTLQDNDNADFSEWWVQQGLLVHMLPAFNSHIEVTMYNLLTGHNRGATSKLPAPWINEGCVLTPPFYSCISGNVGAQRLLSVDVTSNAVQIISKPLFDYISLDIFEGNLRPLDANSAVPGFIIDDKKIVLIKNNDFELLSVNVADESASASIIDGSNGALLLQAWTDKILGFSLIAHNVNSGQEVSELKCSDRNLRIPEAEIAAVMCTRTAKEHHACRILVNGADDAIHLMQQGGRVLWTREEALANVVAAEFVDLPVSETEATIESEFDQKEGSIWAAFSRRLQTQFQQLQTLLHSFQHRDRMVENSNSNNLVRDYFNLHKILVLVTDVGKIIGMDNLSGEILWRRYEPSLDAESVGVFTRRTAWHPPYDAYLTIVGKHEETGNGLIISLNPINGELVGERFLQLDARLLQCAMLHRADEEKLHGLAVLYEDENIQVFPVSSERLVKDMYIYVADRETAKVQGYALKYDGKSAYAQKIWSVALGGAGAAGHRIVAAAARSRLERTHSPGRALADRSVLYKYTNPNLVLFLTEGPDPVHKEVVRAVAVDVASGAVAAATSHRRARALPLAVHADNCLAYLYRSDKHRRLEIATMELYEGKERWLPAGAAFSSFASERAPAVQRQAYILPAAATAAAPTVTERSLTDRHRQAYNLPAGTTAAAPTITERSLTDRHVLLALTTGAIVEIPWAFLDPRRPAMPTAEQREEGLLPYVPELPLPADAVLNYNRTVHRVSALYTHPAGIESTSLVLATGLGECARIVRECTRTPLASSSPVPCSPPASVSVCAQCASIHVPRRHRVHQPRTRHRPR
ncbi:unnamed protein product [Parnassius apollo]|uniref:ER membrane protein complex subunit 1 n=1 Tax=Parnassius apollo TaxID=110799 RepID=A0A8S3WMP2_PARAO|nr:unnamed protein product [Parnassius apollo]